ncbi:MAG: adenylate kinase family protein [Thermoplasmata archaeon]|nr:adenylate kinase family protein [Thermoplasmata archaeon]
MTLFCLTGTPGTGKSSVSAELRSRGWDVVDGKAFLREHGLLGDYDEERDTYEVDLDDFNDALDGFRDSEGTVILDSHLSHFMDSSGIVVLRCRPAVLAERLMARGYSEAKVRENVQAEILDEILVEATETDIPVGELDTTSATVAEIADAAEKIISGHASDYPPGSTDWSTEMEEWF